MDRSDWCRLCGARVVFLLRVRVLQVDSLLLGSVTVQWSRDLGKRRSRLSEVILGYRLSSSLEEFLSAPIYSPLSGHHLGPSIGIRVEFKGFLTLTGARSKDGISRKGVGSSVLRWQELPDVGSAYECVSLRERTVTLGCDG